MNSTKGTVIQIMGPVLDIRFPADSLPELLTAVKIVDGERTVVAEVEQHIGDNVVRCVAMSSTDGLRRGMEAENTGGPIAVPVGEACLGRVFNLLGEPIDEKELPLYWNVRNKGEGYRKMRDIVGQWTDERMNLQRLDMDDNGKGIDIYDMRDIAKHTVYHLDGLRAELYRATRAVRQEDALLAELSPEYGEAEVRDALAWLCEENLTVHIGHEYLALAVDMNTRKVRIRV